MILDRLANADTYRNLEPRIAAALDYLRRTDFSRVPLGRHELDGPRLAAIVQRYRTKPAAEAAFEAHRRYVDVQYVVAGVERIGYAPLDEAAPPRRPYDADKDIAFYDAAGPLLEVRAGMFAIYWPHDLHAPGLAAEGAAEGAEVLKVVVKCLVNTPSIG